MTQDEWADLGIGIARSLPVERLLALAVETGARHIIQDDGLEFEAELETAKIMSESPLLYLRDPIGTIFGPSRRDLKLMELTFAASEKKHRLLDAVSELVSQLPKSRAILLQALSITDELYTNAAKNAWDADQTPFTDTPRNEGKIEFFAVADERRLILGCRDNFGKLQVQPLLERLHYCSVNGIARSIRNDTFGAGIGAFTTLESSSSYYAGVEPGANTVVCAALPLGVNRRTFDQMPKNIHLIY
jgi:hypothetical protein